MGASARAMLEALLEGEGDPSTLAELARGRMRSKRDLLAQALQGRFTAHHRFLIREQLAHIDGLEEHLAELSKEIAQRLRPFEAQLKRLETIPGIKRRLAARHPRRDRSRHEPLPQCAASGFVGRHVSGQQ